MNEETDICRNEKDEEKLNVEPNVQRVVWVKDSLWKQFSRTKKEMGLTWNEYLIVTLELVKAHKIINELIKKNTKGGTKDE